MKKDSLEALMRRYDRHHVGESVASLKKQISQIERNFPKKISGSSRTFNALVVCAMGGSGLGTDILRYLYEPYCKIPLIIVNGYDLPAFVNKDTLVVTISYSGDTEEILSCLRQALKRKATVVTISSGGKLVRLAAKYRVSRIIFSTENNPSGQPRLGNGYTMASLYMLMKRFKLFKKGSPDLIEATKRMKVGKGGIASLARETSRQSYIIIAAEHLRGNAHAMSNQINESAKVFAPFYFIPELNHHLLEGLGSLKVMRSQWMVLTLESKLYHPRIQRRFAVTKRVLAKQGFKIKTISFSGTRVEQALKCLSYGGYLSYYLGLYARKDPSLIPWVDYFKEQM